MTDYVKSTNFASKDALATGNPLKIVKGTEIDTEFNNIAVAVATKADLNSPAFIGTPTAPTPASGNSTTLVATTAFVSTAVTSERTAAVTLTNKTLTSPAISSPTMTGTPVAPTASADNNTTQVATTAFVKTAIDNYDASLTVSASQIESNAVTTAKILDANVTSAKLADSGVSAGSYGSSTAVPVITVNSKGQITSASTTAVSTPIGVSQSWQNVTGSRALNTSYTNTTGRPIMVTCSVLTQSASNPASASVGGVTILNSWTVDCCGVPQFSYFPFSFIVPAGSSYQINGNLGFSVWAELR